MRCGSRPAEAVRRAKEAKRPDPPSYVVDREGHSRRRVGAATKRPREDQDVLAMCREIRDATGELRSRFNRLKLSKDARDEIADYFDLVNDIRAELEARALAEIQAAQEQALNSRQQLQQRVEEETTRAVQDGLNALGLGGLLGN